MMEKSRVIGQASYGQSSTPLNYTRQNTTNVDTLSIGIAAVLRDAAKYFGAERTAGHDHCRKPHEDLKAGNAPADFAGVATELPLMVEMERLGLKPRGYILLAKHAPKGADFTLGGVRYSIKATQPGRGFVCINEAQRVSPSHRFDYLLPVALSADCTRLSVYAPVPFDEVAQWQLREGHSLYRSRLLSQLSPLASLHDLPRGGQI